MSNVLSRDRKLTILRLLVEGNSLRGITRATACHRSAVTRVLTEVGDSCRQFLDEQMRNLKLRHIQADEVWTFVAKKQARLTMREREQRGDIGDMYLWVAFDEDTKLVPTFILGKRSADMARRFMVDLAKRLTPFPNPHASDDHAFRLGQIQPITQLSTDGFAPYPEAVDLAFGRYVRYGQCIKDFRNANLPYTPSEMVGTVRKPIFGLLRPSEIGTSHVERNNATIRHFVKRFARLSYCFSRTLDNLAAACALHFAYFNYCWRPRTTRITPAMAAGITQTLWSVENLYDYVSNNYQEK